MNVDTPLGYDIYLSYAGKRMKVPLRGASEDRSITLDTLNQLLMPDYEIRICTASEVTDTMMCVPLSTADWAGLEKKYGQKVAQRFRKA